MSSAIDARREALEQWRRKKEQEIAAAKKGKPELAKPKPKSILPVVAAPAAKPKKTVLATSEAPKSVPETTKTAPEPMKDVEAPTRAADVQLAMDVPKVAVPKAVSKSQSENADPNSGRIPAAPVETKKKALGDATNRIAPQQPKVARKANVVPKLIPVVVDAKVRTEQARSKANAAAERGDFEMARQLFTTLAETEKGTASFWIDRAFVEELAGDHKAVVQMFEKAAVCKAEPAVELQKALLGFVTRVNEAKMAPGGADPSQLHKFARLVQGIAALDLKKIGFNLPSLEEQAAAAAASKKAAIDSVLTEAEDEAVPAPAIAEDEEIYSEMDENKENMGAAHAMALASEPETAPIPREVLAVIAGGDAPSAWDATASAWDAAKPLLTPRRARFNVPTPVVEALSNIARTSSDEPARPSDETKDASSVVIFTPIRASKRAREITGEAVLLSPVRRSTRKTAKRTLEQATLEDTNYGYAPNPALQINNCEDARPAKRARTGATPCAPSTPAMPSVTVSHDGPVEDVHAVSPTRPRYAAGKIVARAPEEHISPPREVEAVPATPIAPFDTEFATPMRRSRRLQERSTPAITSTPLTTPSMGPPAAAVFKGFSAPRSRMVAATLSGSRKGTPRPASKTKLPETHDSSNKHLDVPSELVLALTGKFDEIAEA